MTRRLYRSGESEYLIDGQVCRLRDVHDLLMDTGLGAKAYAIIEQGKIGLILSTRPTDRRQLIEEAAGVTKYKARRRVGGAEARGRAAEPHAHRRHRLRGREAARHAEAPGRQGAALPEAARRAAALGEGAVRAQVPPAGRDDRVGARRGSPRRASARRSPAARVARGRSRSRPRCASSWSRPSRARPTSREAAHARELAINRQQQQIAFDREQVQTLERAHRERGRRARGARGAARAGAARARSAPRGRGRRPTPSAIAPRRRWPSESEAYEVGAPRDRRARGRRRSGAQRGVLRAQLRDGAAPRARARRGGARPRRRDAGQARRRDRATCGSNPSASRPIARAAVDGLRRAHEAIEATRDRPTRRASPSSPARASSTSGARDRCARASTSSPASTRG